MEIFLETERVILRRINRDDVDNLFGLNSMIRGYGGRVPHEESCRTAEDLHILTQSTILGLQTLDLRALFADHSTSDASINPGLVTHLQTISLLRPSLSPMALDTAVIDG